MGLQRNGKLDINQVRIVQPLLFTDDFSEAETILFSPLKPLDQPRAVFVEKEEPLWFLPHLIVPPFSNLS